MSKIIEKITSFEQDTVLLLTEFNKELSRFKTLLRFYESLHGALQRQVSELEDKLNK